MPEWKVGATLMVEWRKDGNGSIGPVYEFDGDWDGAMAKHVKAHFFRAYRHHKDAESRKLAQEGSFVIQHETTTDPPRLVDAMVTE